MSRRPTTSRGARVLVVCPTEYGGQIEHAADTAMALAADTDGSGAAVLAEAGVVAELRAGAAEAFDGLVRPSRPLHTLVGF